jgi:hypothetical protein
VFWTPPQLSGWPSSEEGALDCFCLFFAAPDSSAAQAVYRLQLGGFAVSELKKTRKNCEHCLRVDGNVGNTSFKFVLGADTAEEIGQWRTALRPSSPAAVL